MKLRHSFERVSSTNFSFRESRDVQISVFRRQMEIAKELDLPLVIHCRDAEEDCIEQLQQVSILKIYN